MTHDPHLDPAPDDFRKLLTGQVLGHLDEIVLSWRMAGHPINWTDTSADFGVNLGDEPVMLFRIYPSSQGTAAGILFDTKHANKIGMPVEFIDRISSELIQVGGLKSIPDEPIRAPLGKFSRGDRKVFLAYTLTAARLMAFNR